MSSEHLTEGSEQPPKIDEKLRLYSVEYCPFAHRARLILAAKNIPHDIVNISLKKKPDWYHKINPEGKVPALDTGTKVVVESLDIVNYLDDEYPNPPLYPAEPAAREQDKALVEKINPLMYIFGKLVFRMEEKSPEEWLKEFQTHLDIFEDELEKRGTTYFFGDKPGMVDYILWPLAERAGIIQIVLGEKLPVTDKQFPNLRKWRKVMRNDPVVDKIYNGPEKLYALMHPKT